MAMASPIRTLANCRMRQLSQAELRERFCRQMWKSTQLQHQGGYNNFFNILSVHTPRLCIMILIVLLMATISYFNNIHY